MKCCVGRISFFQFEFLCLRFPVEDHGSFHGQVDLLTPSTAQAGVTVTLTLTVRALNSPESNYAVAYLTVVPPVSNNRRRLEYSLFGSYCKCRSPHPILHVQSFTV